MTPIWNLNSVTLRQREVPIELQGRGTRRGLTAAVVIGGLVASSSAIPLLLGRIPALRLPDAQNRMVASANL